jgi:hypothetical protein
MLQDNTEAAPPLARVGVQLGGLLQIAACLGEDRLGLRFRPSPDAVAWRRGAVGERRTAHVLRRWSGRGGRSCTTWPSCIARRTSIAMIPGAAVAVRSDPTRPAWCLESGSVDWGCGRRRRVYRLTPNGRTALLEQQRSWQGFSGAVQNVLKGVPWLSPS